MKAVLVLLVVALPVTAAAEFVIPIESVEQFINIRAEPDVDSDIIGRLYQGDKILLVETIDGWFEIEIEPDFNGFISRDWAYTVTEAELLAADTIDEAEEVTTEEPEEESATALVK
jgi:uncharacterized protein YgiM (DUF1202 family)